MSDPSDMLIEENQRTMHGMSLHHAAFDGMSSQAQLQTLHFRKLSAFLLLTFDIMKL